MTAYAVTANGPGASEGSEKSVSICHMETDQTHRFGSLPKSDFVHFGRITGSRSADHFAPPYGIETVVSIGGSPETP
jgi:hypothetical protein